MYTCFIKGLFIAMIGLFGLISPGHAILEIDITQGQIKPTPIAVTKFVGQDKLSQDMADVISKDLESSGLFILINSRGFNQTPESILTEGPRFEDWRMLNAQCLVVGSLEVSGGEVRVQFRLFDVIKGTQLLGLELKIEEKKWRRLAHMIADQIYHRITGEQGYFNTRIAFIEEQGPRGKSRVYRLGTMDYDGENVKYHTNGKNRVLSPRISPNNRDIAYLAYHNKDAQVYVHNMETGGNTLLGKVEGGMSFAPRFSPNGEEILMSLEKRGTSAIYLKNVSSGGITPLTQHQCIDTSPCFSPDQSQIVFTSDRGKTAQLYVMDRNGGNVNRISFGEGRYFSPVWSPRGDLIAFIKQSRGQFHIGVIRPDGTDERLITGGYLVDSPAWSPNGRVILFTREDKARKGSPVSKLWAVDLTGRGLHQVKTPREATDGNWSQLLDEVKAD